MSENLEALRTWYAANKTSPDFQLAIKHRNTFGLGVAEKLKSEAPGDTDEEKELGLIFALTSVAAQLDLHAILLAGLTVEMFSPLSKRAVPVSHVDVTPVNLLAAHDVTPVDPPSKP